MKISPMTSQRLQIVLGYYRSLMELTFSADNIMAGALRCDRLPRHCHVKEGTSGQQTVFLTI